MAAPGKQTAKIKVYENDSTVSKEVCNFIVDLANDCINCHGFFYIGLSGGSMAKMLSDNLPGLKTDWTKWKIFFCDERHVPYDDKECTYTIYKQGLFSKVPIKETNIFPNNPSVTVVEAAEEYSRKLVAEFGGDGIIRFDLLMLGMGPDGHTCSLFPNHALLEEKEKLVAPISDSPKPPSERITFTFPVLQNCATAMFVACGAGKADMVKRVIEGGDSPPLPASRVQPQCGTLYWFLDRAAASKLSTDSSL